MNLKDRSHTFREEKGMTVSFLRMASNVLWDL